MKLLINLLIILSLNNVFSQDLSYLNKIGFDLVNDIKNTTTTGYINDSILDIFMRKAIINKLKEEKTEKEKLKLIKESREKFKSTYSSTSKKTKTLLEDNGFIMDEFDLWANVPLSWEIVESTSSNEMETPDLSKDNLSVLKCFFLLGDLDKRVVIDATVIAYNNTYSIIEFSKPTAFFTFLMNETYGIMYAQTKKILEKTLMSTNSVSRITDGNPLVGEKYNEEWNKCAVQLFDKNTPTLIKLNADDDSWLSTPKAEIKVRIFEEVSYEVGLRNMKDLLGIFAQQFVIRASDDNNFSSDKHIKVYTNQALNYNKKENTTTGNLEFKDGAGNRIIYTLKLVMSPAKKETYNIDMYFIEK